MTPSLLEHIQRRPKGWLIPLGLSATLLLGLLNTLVLLYQGMLLNHIAHQPPSTQVQLVNGKSILTEQRDHDFRTEAVQRQFVSNLLPLLLWKAPTYPPELGKTGTVQRVTLKNGKTVPDLNYTASFGLREQWRDTFLQDLSTDPGRAMAQEIVLRISDLYNFQRDPTHPDHYAVDITASLYYYDRVNGIPLIKKYNSRVHLIAVEPPSFPLKPTPAQLLVNGLMASGLQIDYIEPLDTP